MPELCKRCGEEGDDRRTLWMACFYDMGELEMPFDQMELIAKPRRYVDSIELESFVGIRVPRFEEIPDAPERKYQFYVLRVCKECRSDWLMMIQEWFRNGANK